MSYQVLARKYRPTRFDELEGQEHVLRALVNALEQNRLHHAYLFTGTRGVGKTTIARILAKCLNCESGVTATPCGECGSCREIAEGRAVDLIEVDAASRTRVEDTRDLLDNVQYMPTRARYKVYLIDEVHMLSTHSFNALLKTLEEPPEHVKFLLATTDPKKLPVTVLSRCLQFNLKNLSPERVVTYLQTILAQEGIEYEEQALWQLGRAADGSMRDALSLTDQAISFGENKLSDADVRAMLGAIDQREVYGLLDALIERDAGALLGKIGEMAAFGPDYEMLLAELLSVLHRVAIAQAIPDGIDNSQGDKELVEAVAAALSREDVQLYYQIGLVGSRDLPLAPDPRDGFEMVMLRMLAFAPEELTGTDGPPAGGESSGNGPAAAGGRSSPVSDILSRIGGESSAESAPKPATPQAESADDAVAPADPPADRVHESTVEAPALPLDQSEAPATGIREMTGDEETAPVELAPSDWIDVFNRLSLRGVTRTLAANCELSSVEGRTCVLTLNEHHASLWNKVHETRIGEALSTYLGRSVGLRIEVGEVRGETPAQALDRETEEARARAVEAIENDENVQRLIETFDGKLNLESVVPRQHAGE